MFVEFWAGWLVVEEGDTETGEKVLVLEKVILENGHVIYKWTVVEEPHTESMNVGVEVE